MHPVNTKLVWKLAREAWGLDLELIYAMDVREHDELLFVALEVLSHDPELPSDLKWFEPAESVDLLDSVQQAFVEAHFAGQEMNDKTQFLPWMSSEWMNSAKTWIIEQMEHLGVSVISVDHVKCSFLGKVLLINTDSGRFYFKAVSGSFCREIEITAALSKWCVECAPELVSYDLERKWMITREVVGPDFYNNTDMAIWESVIGTYARFQKRSVQLFNSQDYSPFYDSRPSVVATYIDWMVGAIEKLQEGYFEPLDQGEIDRLRELAPRLEGICHELEGCGVSNALDHSDLHPGNIVITQEGPVFMDWAWSCVTNPFLSMCLLFHEKKLPEGMKSFRDQVIKTYLSEWSDYATEDELLELYRSVERWRIIQYAVADAQWVRSYLSDACGEPIVSGSYIEWALRQRQYYLIKTLRRVLEI